MNDNSLAFLFVIPIKGGVGTWPFPSQLKENLFKNSVKVKGLYSTTAHKNKDGHVAHLFAICNASQHMACGKKVITNVLGVFNFEKDHLFQLNGATVTAPCNVIPRDIKFQITDENFKQVKSFDGWIWTQISGVVKKSIE